SLVAQGDVDGDHVRVTENLFQGGGLGAGLQETILGNVRIAGQDVDVPWPHELRDPDADSSQTHDPKRDAGVAVRLATADVGAQAGVRPPPTLLDVLVLEPEPLGQSEQEGDW